MTYYIVPAVLVSYHAPDLYENASGFVSAKHDDSCSIGDDGCS